MSDHATTGQPRIAFRMTTWGDAAAFEAALQRMGRQAGRRFEPKDDDELDARLQRGEFDIAVFADAESLIEMILNGDAALDVWMTHGVALEFASGDDESIARRVHAVYSRNARRRRRRQATACLVLSLVALASLGILFWCLPRPV